MSLSVRTYILPLTFQKGTLSRITSVPYGQDGQKDSKRKPPLDCIQQGKGLWPSACNSPPKREGQPPHGSVGKVLVLQAQGPEFHPQDPDSKSQAW